MRIGDHRVGALKTRTAQLEQELGLIRGLLPHPDLLIAAANILDHMIPDDPEPEVQAGLRRWAQTIMEIHKHSGVGKESFEALKAAYEYHKAHEHTTVDASPAVVEDARKAHARMLRAMKTIDHLFAPPEPRHGQENVPEEG